MAEFSASIMQFSLGNNCTAISVQFCSRRSLRPDAFLIASKTASAFAGQPGLVTFLIGHL